MLAVMLGRDVTVTVGFVLGVGFSVLLLMKMYLR